MEFRLARRSSATAGESEHTSWSVVSSHVVDVLTRPAILLASSQNTVHGLEMRCSGQAPTTTCHCALLSSRSLSAFRSRASHHLPALRNYRSYELHQPRRRQALQSEPSRCRS